jgi:CRP/FNR family transcriptional regulator, dissimilatory nitrate respiration regulator
MIPIMPIELENHLRHLRARPHVFGPGQYLFHLGDPIRVIHFVRSGLAHLIRGQNDGAALVLQQAGAGSILAEASFCSDHYHCDAIAIREIHSLAYGVAEFRARLRSAPDFADAWARHLAHELQNARLHAEILSLRTVAGRLDAWLAWRGGALPAKGDWRTIANEIGVSPEALYREIAKRRVPGEGKQ